MDVDIEGKSLVEILLSLEKISQSQLDELDHESVTAISEEDLLRHGWVTQDDISLALALQFGVEVIKDFSLYPGVSKEQILKVPYSFSKKNHVALLEEKKGRILVALSDPLNVHAVDELRFFLGKDIEAAYASQGLIDKQINVSYDLGKGQASDLISGMGNAEIDLNNAFEIDSYDLLEQKDLSPVVKLLNVMITEAIQQGASDIHFEPFEKDLKVRYRIDGVLHNRHSPPYEYQAQILTRLKVMAKLDIAERRLPQDGRIKLNMGTREIDFRVSTVPVVNGERIVMRILDKGNIVLGLDKLGMPPKITEKFRQLSSLPEGILLVTGPTGSGKTTTLYSSIQEISSDEVNIMTIEDPVEYKFNGIAQIGVKPKINLNFSMGLRHILRQDPDIIMVGEIRDLETAEIAIQAALTGHLVLSTLHTNDAPSAMTRLVDMGIEPYLLSSSVVGVLAQRLVRRICSHCIESYDPEDEELQQLGMTREELGSEKFYRGQGCNACFNSGYKGQHGIYELMVVTHSIKRQLTKNADAVLLRKIAIDEGMLTLRANGAYLVKKGISSTEEVMRVTRVSDIEV